MMYDAKEMREITNNHNAQVEAERDAAAHAFVEHTLMSEIKECAESGYGCHHQRTLASIPYIDRVMNILKIQGFNVKKEGGKLYIGW